MAPYLTLAEFRARTVMPGVAVDELELVAPGFVVARLTIETSALEARLSKRYATPFAAPVPDVVLGWLTSIVTEQAYRKRGVDPNDAQAAEYVADADRAREEVLEAANSDTGLFELPLRQDTTASGVSKAGPRSYSEAGPYSWTDRQVRAARDEDASANGGTRRG